jgi:DNA-binding response OmpR family regulator
MLTMKNNNHKILIVEDDIDILTVLTMTLKEEGYQVEGTLNGDETFTRTERFKPDLVIMDIYLSGTNGKEICKKLKSDKKTSHIPVILISASTQLRSTVKECGADGFISKPFDTEDLLYGISNFLPQYSEMT